MIRPKEKSSPKDFVPVSGEAAAQRAIRKVYQKAAQEGRKLPVWKDGRVKWIDPSENG